MSKRCLEVELFFGEFRGRAFDMAPLKPTPVLNTFRRVDADAKLIFVCGDDRLGSWDFMGCSLSMMSRRGLDLWAVTPPPDLFL